MKNNFSLSPIFLKKYEGTQPNWGFGTLSYFTYKRTYSRLKEDGTQEEFFDTIKRCVEGSFNIQYDHCKRSHLPWDAYKAQKSAQKMFEKMWEFKFLPPGRGLWVMGTPIIDKLGSAPLQNCGFVSTESIDKDFSEPFAWACDMLMLGVGIGYDTLGAGKVVIKKSNPIGVVIGVNTYTIPDTREGWVESIKKLLDGYTKGLYYMFDYSQIRPAGTPIKGFGGTASGPQPLIDGHNNLRKLLDTYDGKPLDSVGIVDIMNYIGKFVVAGNVRRSAEIAIGNINDTSFIKMKDYNLYPNELLDRRWMSNNSVEAIPTSNFDSIVPNIALNGEPGLIFLINSRHYGRFKDGFYSKSHPKYDNAKGVNPCVTADTWIMTVPNGPMQVKDLIGSKTYDKKYLIDAKVHKGTNFYSTGLKETYNLKTREGYSVRLTNNHRVLTTNGWVEAGHLTPGDKIILNNHRCFDGLAWGSPTTTSRDHGYLLGHLIGDGTFSNNKAILSVWDNDGEQEVIQHIEKICSKLNTRSDFTGFNLVKRDSNLSTIDEYRLSCKAITEIANSYDVSQGNKFITDKMEQQDSEFQRGLLAGLFDTDGSIQGTQEKGISVRLTSINFELLQRVQRILLRFGIVSSIYSRRKEQDRLLPDSKGGYRSYLCQEIYELVIANDSLRVFYDSIPILNRNKSEKLKTLLTNYKRNLNQSKFICTFETLEYYGLEEVYDVTVENVHRFDGNGIMLHNCAEQILDHMELCNLVETFPANHATAEEYLETLKYAYLYAKSVTLLPTHCEKTNQVMIRNRRIGCSQSGIQQAIKKFGIQTYLNEFCDKGYSIISYWDQIYSRWLGIPTSIRTTTVKPSGTISLLAGATPGVHCTHSEYYYRTVRVASNSPLIPKLKKANYRIEESVTDKNTLVIYFPVKETNYTKSKYDISLWEQLTLVKELQHSWSDNSVSCTVTFKPEEVKDLKSAIEYFAPYVKTLSFLPLDDHNYPQAPYQTITEQEYNTYLNSLTELDLSDSKEESKGEKYCNNDTCSI